MSTAIVKKSESDAVKAKVEPKPQATDDQSAPPVEEPGTDPIKYATDILTKTDAKLPEYADALRELAKQSDLWDKNLGYHNWLQGRVLAAARPKCKAKGKWGAFLKRIGWKGRYSHARHLMRIATVIREVPAKEMSYSDMLGYVYESYADVVLAAGEADEQADRRTAKNSTTTEPTEPKPKTVPPGVYRNSLDRLCLLTVDGDLDDAEVLQGCADAIETTITKLTEARDVIQGGLARLANAEGLEAA